MPDASDTPRVFYVMGVSGCGKSTIGQRLAQTLDLPFYDGDDFHPDSNVQKMAEGIPLDDCDRQPWLERLNHLAIESPRGAVIACSALKQVYRQTLAKRLTCVYWIYLAGDFDEIFLRLSQRENHFMPASLLRSQFATLEPPENAITLSALESPDSIVQQIIEAVKVHE